MENSQIIAITNMEEEKTYYFQTISNISINSKSEITTYPTTEGTPKTDNIYAQPKNISFSFVIGGCENISDEWGNGAERPKNAFDMLDYWKSKGVPFTISTPQVTMYNMFITSISPTNDTKNAYNLSASIQFKELIIAKFETKTVGPFTDDKTKANESKEEDNGKNEQKIEDVIDKKEDLTKPILNYDNKTLYKNVGNAVKSVTGWVKKLFDSVGRFLRGDW